MGTKYSVALEEKSQEKSKMLCGLRGPHGLTGSSVIVVLLKEEEVPKVKTTPSMLSGS